MSKEKTAAKQEIVSSIRDLLTLKVTLPLGNPNLKLVHTNQYCKTELPEFLLSNFKVISKALNSSYNRYSGYTTNKWYIEGRTIVNDGKRFTMELDLNPFASTLLDFKDNREGYEKSYTDAINKSEKENSKKSNTKKTTNSGGGEGEIIDSLVSKIIGKENNELKKAKLIHAWLTSNVTYSRYACSRYKTPEQCLKNKGHLNCADTSRLTRSMMSSAGLDSYVVHGTNHFWTVININGKEYNSDATSHRRKFNQVYHNLKYYATNGKNPSC